MIMSDEGKVIIKGKSVIVTIEAITMLGSLIQNFRKCFGEEGANEYIAFIGRAAVDTADGNWSEESAEWVANEVANLQKKWGDRGDRDK